MCTTNSQHDIAIVTTNGVHLYDDAASLTNGACGNKTIVGLFQGFTPLPDSSTWNALLTYNNDKFDLFTSMLFLSIAATVTHVNKPIGSQIT